MSTQVSPASIQLFYEESKSARTLIDSALEKYRANTTTVLALATGATAFFGLSSSTKNELLYVSSLVAYGAAVFVALSIYLPTKRKVNVAYDTESIVNSNTGPAIPLTKFHWDYALGHQKAVSDGISLISGWRGLRSRFTILTSLTGLVVILAGLSIAFQPDAETPKPTHIVIERISS
ncbi:hypothetical protein [Rhodococcus sp. 1139]|uniref:hypothetical protein n=1 Tax=Rhodococcus sp. 1139 TaxID=1833762 RepID=UPI00114CFFA4|nr:hypothetical protein [Rhodococcus sp. 1139]